MMMTKALGRKQAEDLHRPDFRSLEIKGRLKLEGVVIGERMRAWEGAHSQIFLARAVGEEKDSLLVKVVDSEWMPEARIEVQQEEDDRAMAFFKGLPEEQGRYFVSLLDAGSMDLLLEGRTYKAFYRVTELLEDACRFVVHRGDGSVERKWWDETRGKPQAMQELLLGFATVFAALESGGFDSTHLTIEDFAFVPTEMGRRPRVLFYGESFLAGEEPDLSTVPLRMRPLWRIHPALLGREAANTEASRAFTLGVALYQILFDEHPYHRPGYEIVIDRDLSWPTEASGSLSRMIQALLSRSEPEDRPKVKELLGILQDDEILVELAALSRGLDCFPGLGSGRARPKTAPASLIRLLFRSFLQAVRRFGLFRVLLPMSRRGRLSPAKKRGQAAAAGVIMRDFCRDAGPLFIKLAQLLTSRKDLFPEPFLDELESLKDKAPLVPFEEIAGVIKTEWGIDRLQEAFLYFDSDPLGCASMAQVHRGRLAMLHHEDVAIKVQKPGVRKSILRDLKRLRRVVGFIGKLPGAAVYQLPRLFGVFEQSIIEELDFTTECNNISQVAANFAGDPSVELPVVFESHEICSAIGTDPAPGHASLLVLGFVCGAPLRDRDGLYRIGIRLREDREQLARNIIRAFLRMVLQHGCYHADPHDGNIFALPGNRIGLIDLGGVGRLTERQRFNLLLLLQGIVQNDSPLLLRSLRLMNAIHDDGAIDLIELDLAQILARAARLSAGGNSAMAMGTTLEGVVMIARKHGVFIPPELGLLSRAIAELEASISHLAPGLDTLSAMSSELPKLVVPPGLVEALQARDFASFFDILRDAAVKPVSRLAIRYTLSSVLDAYSTWQATVRSAEVQRVSTAMDGAKTGGWAPPFFLIGSACAVHLMWVLPAGGETPALWLSRSLFGLGILWGIPSLFKRRSTEG